MGKNIFITGASGYMGKALVKTMIEADSDRFYLLTRSARTEEVLKEEFKWIDPERITYVRGDITLPHLGIPRKTLIQLSRTVEEAWHMAASTSFDESKKREIETTNITGTQNVLDFLGLFDKLGLMHYVSTAYVCGKDQGTIPEDRLDYTNGFKNPYEQTKCECEALVRDSGLPFAIIRPSIILGNSKTGESRGETRMVYGYFLAMYYSALHKFGGENQFRNYWSDSQPTIDVDARLPGDGRTTKNLVTLDDVVNVCMAVKNSTNSQGKTYNLVNPQNITVGEMANIMQEALKIKGYRFDPTLTRDNLNRENMTERAVFKHTKPFWPYVNIPEPTWKTDNVNALGIERVTMTPQLFEFLMKTYLDRELIGAK